MNCHSSFIQQTARGHSAIVLSVLKESPAKGRSRQVDSDDRDSGDVGVPQGEAGAVLTLKMQENKLAGLRSREVY